MNCTVNMFINSSPPSAAYYASVKKASIGSDDGLSPIQRQAIIQTNAVIVNWNFKTSFSKNLSKIQQFSFTKMHEKAPIKFTHNLFPAILLHQKNISTHRLCYFWGHWSFGLLFRCTFYSILYGSHLFLSLRNNCYVESYLCIYFQT